MERRTRVLLITVGAKKVVPQTESRMQDILSERDDLAVQGLGSIASLAASASDPGTAGDRSLEARRRLEQGREAFSRFEYAGATAHFKEALRLLRPLAVQPAGRERLAAIHLELAKVLLVHGERGAAIDQILTCLHLDPAWSPDPGRFPPELRALHAKLSKAGARPKGELRIESVPEGASVQLDGRQQASTPVEWQGVSAGPHYIIVTRDGFRTHVGTVTVTPEQKTSRKVQLTPGTAAERAAAALRQLSRLGGRAERRWRATATDLSRSNALVVAEARGDVRLSAFDTRGAELGSRVLTHDALPREGGHWLDRCLPPPDSPWYGKWWFWTPLAAAAAGAVALGVYFGTRTPDVTLVGGGTVR
jgi:hypothetical protein